MKKKIAIISIVIVLLLILFFPVKAHLDDGGSNGTCYFDAKIVELTEDKIVLESTKEGVGPIRPETPVAFDILLVSDKIRGGLWVGDEVRIMYNDKRVQVENPLWLEVVFAVYPLDENGEVISESGVTLHQGFVPDPGVYTEADGEDVWVMYTETLYSSLLLTDGAGTVELSLKKLLETYPTDMPVEEMLELAKGDNCVVSEDSRVTSGGEYWEKFLEKVQEQKNAQIRLVKYHSLGEENPYAPEFYELKKKEYPKVDFYSLVYVAGEGFWLGYRPCTKEEPELVRCYNYLKHYGGDTATPGSVDSHYDRYVLVDDDSVTWEDIMQQMARSVHTEDDIVWRGVYYNYIE